ncbi:prefoldin subunit 3, putative [Eimeria tenella]|uniref:Prefoldin subunit 3 n=1 Tax=Eimeria tenella TaxID=5802 RepID=H9B9P8_EIMTE|nr:prefoldin subunit 3, putative [Eimeria tenella]AET50708.1 hypothetical protein [Eimeria tenella]CDJ41560.1 prefoldin subunit 3, putative [Eimeria tenella]|eukprot:XP_013232310.1 prefoldin subunit 3, putative [Eimeria tenella]
MARDASEVPVMRLENLVIAAKDGEHRNIPRAKFIENVESFVGSCDPTSVEWLLKELLQKYRFMERSLLGQKCMLRAKAVAIKETMEAVAMLQKQRDRAKEGKDGDLTTRLQLAETVYVQATIPPKDTVCLWLAADVFVEYTLEEAEEVLSKSLNSATKYLGEAAADLEWLREQIIMTEVNGARVHNFAVHKMQQRQAAAAEDKTDRKKD